MLSTAYGHLRRATREVIGPGAIDLMYWLLSRGDWDRTQRTGRALGDFGYRFDGRHRKVALANVRLAYGEELPEERVREIVRGAFRHVTTLFAEVVRGSGLSREQIRDICVVRGEEHLQAALAQGKGVVLFAGHLGNWEIGGARLMCEDYDVRPFARPPPTPRLARKFQELHDRQGTKFTPFEEGLRGILRALRSNAAVPILPDRFARGQGVTVPYFGRPTHVWPTPAMLAARVGCPVLPWSSVRGEDGMVVTEIGPPIEMHFTDDREDDLAKNTTRCMALLEREVRAVPEQYAWFYQLWRDLPPPGSSEEPTEGAGSEPGSEAATPTP